jgi:transposase InsO family protein
MRSIFAAWQLSEIFVSNNGHPFQAEEFKTFLKRNSVKQVFSPPYNAEVNGQAEKSVQHLKQTLAKSVLDPRTANLLVIIFSPFRHG